MATFYLDVDDEITSAAARIRDTADPRVVLVLPAASRIATSRINFRLLAREAHLRSRRLAIVAPEASTRALAASAGIPVFATIMEYESAEEDAGPGASDPEVAEAGGAAGLTKDTAARPPGDPSSATRTYAQARRLTAEELAAREAAVAAGAAPGAPGGPDGAAGSASARDGGRTHRDPARFEAPHPDGARPLRDAAARESLGPTTGLPERPAAPPPRRRGRTGLAVVIAVLLLALVAGGVAGYLLLPTATVVLAVRTVDVGPLDFTVRADPAAIAPDPTGQVVPAVKIEIPLAASGSFKATGKRVNDVAGTGSVRWTNCDPTRAYTLPAGTLARTGDGTAFADNESVFLPVAVLSGSPPQITCQNRTVAVTAVKPGPAGNVAAGTITVIPGAYNSVVIRVTNPSPTAGGLHQEFPKIAQKDVDGAVAALTKQLADQLAAAAAAPDGLPAGATAYPETAAQGSATPSVDPATLVGQELDKFDLTLSATGTVLAVDASPVQALGEAALAAAVPAAHDVVPGSAAVTIGPGTVDGQSVTFGVIARARAVARVDEAAIRAAVRGRTPAEAMAALAAYGTATITIWPDWSRSITTFDSRLEVRLEGLPSASGASGTSAPATRPPVTHAPATRTPPASPPASAEPSSSAGTSSPSAAP